MIDEKKLIEQILRGSDEAFAQLVKAYEDKVYNLCLRMCGDREEAMDLAQESFIKAWRGLRFYKAEASFSTWLYRLTSNVCIDHLRKRKRRETLSLTVEEDEQQVQLEIPDPSASPQEQVEERQRKQMVAQAMDQLEEEFRMVLTLRIVEELSYDEIADVLDLKVGTVRSRLSRAREKLRKILLKNGNDLFPSNVKSHERGEEL